MLRNVLRPAVAGAAFVLLLLPAAPASGSQLFTRNATNVKLAVNARGKALITYKINGKTRRALVWGAVNARAPTQDVTQVRFRIDYTGGGKKVWRSFKNRCRRYDGPDLVFPVTACKAPDGSYWAVQKWHYWQPAFGYLSWLPYQNDWAFHVSHWSGPLAQVELWSGWIDVARGVAAPHAVFGRVKYGATAVFGYAVKTGGIPGDGYGRVVIIDSFDSLLGAGWWRVAGLLARNPSGPFCHAMVPLPSYSNYPNSHVVDPGSGKSYRAYLEGPGVTPAVVGEVDDPGNYQADNPADVQRATEGRALLEAWQAPAACLKGH